MTCTSCGDKPKNSSKGFPRAVVEINNPESLVLLRKVVIPVSMGTEEDVPPTIGKYFNVLLQYESNGHIYLYSSDGIPTAIEANIPQEVLDRIDQLEIDVDLLETGLANETEAREAADTTLQNNITAEATARANADTALNTAITSEVTARQTADAGLQSQIDAITASSDVKDIVGTKAELNNYDTSTLGNNDIIKVLQDESENNATTYYRWNATTQQFTLIGEEGPYYTKSQADTLLNAKQNTLTAGSNVQIVNDTISATDTTYTAGTGLTLNGTQFSVDTTAIATQSDLTAGLATKQDTLTAGTNIQINNNTISATDTTYSNFVGTDGTTAGTAGLVPAPATADAGKFLKADGTWATAGGGGPTVVQTTGTSTTDVMSQNAVTSMVFADPATQYKIKIGFGASSSEGDDGIEIGHGAGANSNASIALGRSAIAGGSNNNIAIGQNSSVGAGYGSVAIGQLSGVGSSASVALGVQANTSNKQFSVALGANSQPSAQGEVSIGLVNGNTTSGYNSSNYRLLTGLYDPQNAHDAATKGYVDNSLLGKQDALTAGDNITIAEESGALVISATGGSSIDAFTTNEWNALWA